MSEFINCDSFSMFNPFSIMRSMLSKAFNIFVLPVAFLPNKTALLANLVSEK